MRADSAIYTAYEEHTPRDIAVAEKNLMRAILRTAFEDMKKRGEPYRQARQFFSSNDIHYVYSFINICYHLNLSHRTIRSRLGLFEGSDERLAA